MNRQAIAFLTLFSLILVLSVYYITLPENNQPAGGDNTEDTTETGAQLDFARLQIELENKREDLIADYNAVIASSTATEAEKTAALASIEATQLLGETEVKVGNAVKELGYNKVFVEIDGSIIKVMVKSTDSNETNAASIIAAVLRASDSKYLPEVSFH